MTPSGPTRPSLAELDAPTAALVRLAAVIAVGDEAAVRGSLASAVEAKTPPVWIDELAVQSYLFSGFPRALNAAREWRRLEPAPASAAESADETPFRVRGERTCAIVYGEMYERLRANVSTLHPALDDLMIVDGYGKVLGRPGLDLARRELCIVAACAATGQERQLHSHLHGALNAGAAAQTLRAAIDALSAELDVERSRSVHLLLDRVLGK
jgi:4-carboxymuconolactone decarboxylase